MEREWRLQNSPQGLSDGRACEFFWPMAQLRARRIEPSVLDVSNLECEMMDLLRFQAPDT